MTQVAWCKYKLTTPHLNITKVEKNRQMLNDITNNLDNGRT